MTILDWSYQIGLAAEPMSARLARDFVCRHLSAHGLTELMDDVSLVVSELATNAVRHAQTPFVVTLSMAGGVVLLALRDESPGVPLRSEPSLMDRGGRGLMIVELVSREWGTSTDTPGCKTVWASFSERRQ
ncbi:MAG: ATP-binding protein [Nocardioides sp.]